MKEIDSYVYSAAANYGIAALVYAIDHCFNGKKAMSEFPKRPITIEHDPKEIAKRNRNKIESDRLLAEMRRINEELAAQEVLKESESR